MAASGHDTSKTGPCGTPIHSHRSRAYPEDWHRRRQRSRSDTTGRRGGRHRADGSGVICGLRGVDTNTGTPGDVIVCANGLTVRRTSDLTDELERVGVGNAIKLTLLRGRQKTSVNVPVTDIGPIQ